MRETMNISLSREIRELIDRAVRGGRYSGASDYVRALVVEERKRSGDRLVERVKPMRKPGRPQAA